jgi:hypothetical protein
MHMVENLIWKKEGHINIMANLLKARTVKPEKQPMLSNGYETTSFPGQRPRNKERNNVRC